MVKNYNGTYYQQVEYHRILENRNFLKKLDSDFFDVSIIAKCYDVAKKYALKYMEPPKKEVVKNELRRAGKISEEEEALIDMLYSDSVMHSGIDPDFLDSIIIATATWKTTSKALVTAAEYMKQMDSNVREHPDMAKQISEHVRMLIDEPLSVNYAEEDSNGSDFWDAKNHIQERLKRRSTGYKFIDECMDGGYWDGSFVVFAGAPKVGKSQFLCNLCAESVKKGYNTMYITLELPEAMVIGRIGSNIFNIPHADYETVSKSSQMRDIIANYRNSCTTPLGELIVKSYPTSTMTAEDLESFVLREELNRSTKEERFKFHNIFVDYINIMRNPNNEYTENTYIKIKNIAEHLKGVGVKNNWAIITATQMNKGQYDKSDARAEDVAESSGLGATVDLLFGIIKDATCAINNQYFIKCIYDRVAPHQEEKKLFNFNGKYLRLTEDVNSKVTSCLVEQQSTYKSVLEKSKLNRANTVYLPGTPSNNSSTPKVQPKVPVEATQVDFLESTSGGTNVNPRAYTPTTTFVQTPKSAYSSVPTIPTDMSDDSSIFGENVFSEGKDF